MFFLAALYSLLQLPKDLYNTGIKDCSRAVNSPFADISTNRYTVRYEKLSLIESTISRRLAIYFPKMDDNFKGQVSQLLQPFLDQSYWASKKTYHLFINGYDASRQTSAMLTIKLTNQVESKGMDQAVLLEIEAHSASYSYIESFYTYTAFDFTNNVISDVKTNFKKEQVTLEIVKALVPPVAPLYYGTLSFVDRPYVKAAIVYLSQFLGNYCNLLNFDEEEAKDAIAEYNKNGYVDFNSISQHIIKVCLTTPTPSPRPTPDPANPDAGLDDDFGQIDEEELKKELFKYFSKKGKTTRSSNSHRRLHHKKRRIVG